MHSEINEQSTFITQASLHVSLYVVVAAPFQSCSKSISCEMQKKSFE